MIVYEVSFNPEQPDPRAYVLLEQPGDHLDPDSAPSPVEEFKGRIGEKCATLLADEEVEETQRAALESLRATVDNPDERAILRRDQEMFEVVAERLYTVSGPDGIGDQPEEDRPFEAWVTARGLLAYRPHEKRRRGGLVAAPAGELDLLLQTHESDPSESRNYGVIAGIKRAMKKVNATHYSLGFDIQQEGDMFVCTGLHLTVGRIKNEDDGKPEFVRAGRIPTSENMQ